ncbi:MAG TPA: PAS domain S-box protein, partial [Lacibacter sp.]|nr:PAS domain S-box protein [Lacibacter sp.]
MPETAEHKHVADDLLLKVSQATSRYVGQDYLRELTKFITLTLGVRYALISECANEEKTKVRTISYVDRGEPLENIEYDLAGTPCEIVMNGVDYFCAQNLEQKFPKEEHLESYVSVPIYSPSTGEVMGHIAALDTKPMHQNQNQTAILKIFAARAGSEIERIRNEEKLLELLRSDNIQLQKKLKESEERYRDLFEEAPFAYVHEGLDSKFIHANRAALKALGVKPEEIPFIYGKTLVAENPENQKRLKEAFESI